ncbi:MAG: hypothetical protein LBP86_08770 [Azoarcus sp.]|jgi:tRNA A-37 threonylcarbamoyl transferase component Bud32|nr:hypothetical protein [Azoarcus sp.]
MTPGHENPAAPPPLLNAGDLVRAGRQLPLPCAIRCDDGGRLDLLRPLRVLPGKRITVEGRREGQPVLAKLFIAPGSASHWQRERNGLAALAAAGVPSASVLAAGALADGGHYLLAEFFPDAPSLAGELETRGAAAVREWLEAACARIGLMHAHGLVHDDPHPGNFLIHADGLRVVDGGGVRRRAAPLPGSEADANLARFLAQLPPGAEEALAGDLIAAYRAADPHHAPEFAALRPLIERHRHRRLDDYLDKTLRPCTLFEVRRAARHFSAVARADADLFAPLLADPDGAMARSAPLKRGHTTTVVRIELAGRSLAVKRYNLKNAAHALSRAWRPSRAWHAWREGHRLLFLGIDTPAPRALIEERLGPLRRRAWLVMDYRAGRDLGEHLAPYTDAAAPPPAESEALLRLFGTLHTHRISHGDLKASNLLWDDARRGIFIIDLDSMTQHSLPATHAHAWRRDRARLLANWPEGSGLHRWLDGHLPKG